MRFSRNNPILTALLTIMLATFWYGCEGSTTDDPVDEQAKAGTEEHADGHTDDCGDWTYTGERGADKWASLCFDNAPCGGERQSPIDIAGATTDGNLSPIAFNYDSTSTAIVNNGHTLQWNVENGGGISLDGTDYSLLQFHLHTKSEHTIDGNFYPLELHLVHQDAASGNLAVVGVLFETGAENNFMGHFMENLPADANGTYNDAMKYFAADVLPASTGYYTYPGSLTTPPCSEIVTWLVLKEPVVASQEQLDALAAIMKENNRPVQPLNGRTVLASN